MRRVGVQKWEMKMVSLAKKERCLIKHILFVIHVLCTLNVRYNFTLRNDMTKLEIQTLLYIRL